MSPRLAGRIARRFGVMLYSVDRHNNASAVVLDGRLYVVHRRDDAADKLRTRCRRARSLARGLQ